MSDVLDLSHHNGVESFEAIKRSGIVGIIHKASEGDYNVDETYEKRRVEAHRAGLLWGSYHFMRPGNQQEQANWYLAAASPAETDLICADYEDDEMNLNDLQAFLAAIEHLTGRKALIYSGHLIKEQVGTKNIPWLAQHQLWVAQYTSAPQPEWPKATWPEYFLWQFTDTGEAPGVSGNVDCNRSPLKEAELRAQWTGGTPTPKPEREDREPVVTITVAAPPGVEVKIVRV